MRAPSTSPPSSRSEATLFAAERLVYAVDHAAKPSPRAKQAADLMRSWDGSAVRASARDQQNQLGVVSKLSINGAAEADCPRA